MSGARTRYLGVAEETTFGTKITTDSSFTYFDFAECGLDSPSEVALKYEGACNRAIVKTAQAQYIPQGDISTVLDGVVAPWFLKWCLGTYFRQEQINGGDEVYRHTIRPADTLPSFTARIGKDTHQRTIDGCKILSLTLDVPKGDFATLSLTIAGQNETKDTIQSLSDIEIIRLGYFTWSQCTISVDGSTAYAESLNLEINNNISPEDGMRLGSLYPQFLEAGYRGITAGVQISHVDETHLTNFWGGASSPTAVDSYAVVITLTGEEINGDNYEFIFTLPAMFYQQLATPVSKRDRIVEDVKLEALYDETSGYDVSLTITNDIDNYSEEVTLRDIAAISATSVVAVGYNGVIYTSTNSGTTWTARTSGVTSRINAIAMGSATVGIAVGDDGVILSTDDAGATWTARTSGVTTDLYDCVMPGAAIAYVVGAAGKILYSTDLSTWTAKTSGLSTALFGIDAISDAKIVAVGAGGKILSSTDGTTWTSRTSGVTSDLMAVSGVTDTSDYWFAVGESGVCLASSDMATWAAKTTGETCTFRGVDVYSSTLAILSGDAKILKTVDNGSNFTDETPTLSNYEMMRGCVLASGTVGYVASNFGQVFYTSDAGANWTAVDIP